MFTLHQLTYNFNDKKKYLPDCEVIIYKDKLKEIEKKISVYKDSALYRDYLRLYIIYENGGLLLDGKFDIVSSIDTLLENDMFLGFKTENTISTELIWAKEKKNKYIKIILDEIEKRFKNSEKENDITDIISKGIGINLRNKINSTVKIAENSYIYSYDYFYPLDYENSGKKFSENTRVIFYDNTKKLSLKKQIKLSAFKKYGSLSVKYIQTLSDILRFRLASKKYIIMQKTAFDKKKKNKVTSNAIEILDNIALNKNEYIIFHNSNWLGVTSATKELFDNLVPIEEIYDNNKAKLLARKINEIGVKQVIFSAFADGWELLAREIKNINSNIKIKVFWHGSHSQVIDTINWRTNVKALNLHREGIIDVFATCKESIVNFYKSQGYRTAFIKNTVRLDNSLKEDIIKNKAKYFSSKDYSKDKIQIGIYSANMAWRKNMFNQIAASSLILNSKICTLPLNFDGQVFSSKLNEEIEGESKGVKREVLLRKMSENDINLYVTFSECAPMLPIESMEVGTLCISGNNHHYFKGTKLEEYLIVDREDDVIEIAKKIRYALDNKDEIFKLYNEWKKDYDIQSKKSVDDFLNM